MRVKSSTKLAKKQHDPLVQNQKNLNDIATTSATLTSIKSPKDDNDDCSNDNDDQLATTTHISNRTSNGKHCQHLNKSINNMNVLKKNLKQAVIGECTSCNEAKSKSSEFKRSKDTSLWLCLYCAHQGCDRHSEHSHALKHYQTPRSVLHCICLNLSTWSLWCYECDDELANCSKRIDDIINGVRKLCSSNTAHHSSGQTIEPTTTETHHTQSNHNSKTSQSSVHKTLVIAQQLLTSQLTSNRKSANTGAMTSSSSSLATHNTKVVGLNNLGNTCFFNAVLQNLVQTPSFENLLQENLSNRDRQETLSLVNENNSNSLDDSDNEENATTEEPLKQQRKSVGRRQNAASQKLEQINICVGEPGPLTCSMYNLLKDMNSVRSNVLSPGSLFSLVCKKVPSFKGYQQQDSHELLRNLLDAIKAEEIKRRQSGILTALNVNKSSVDDSLKQKIKAYGRLANFTFIDSLFGGSLLSTVVCEQCKMCSQNIEPFLDLSLPIVDEKAVHNNALVENMAFSKTSTADDNRESMSKHQLKKQKHLVKKSKKKASKCSKIPIENNNAAKQQETAFSSSNENENDDNDEEDVDYIDEELADGTSTSAKQNENDQTFQLNTLEAAINETNQKEMTLNDYKLEAMQSLTQRRLNPSSSQQGDEQSSCSLQSCLYKFTSPEILSGLNKFGCENCTRVYNRNNNNNKAQQSARTVYTQAIKQYLLCELPAVLTIHLKRFQQHGYRLEKVNKHVNFPLQLDMSSYTSKHCTNLLDNASAVYSLYGLVEHSGRLNGGHYTAYVKSRKKQNIDKYLIRERLSALKPYLNWSSLNSFVRSQTDGSSTNSEEEPSENYAWYYISDSQVTEVPESKILKLQAYILFYERS